MILNTIFPVKAESLVQRALEIGTDPSVSTSPLDQDLVLIHRIMYVFSVITRVRSLVLIFTLLTQQE